MRTLRRTLFGLGILLILLALTIALTRASPRRSSTPQLPAQPYNYANINLPTHFTTPPLSLIDNTPENNPITNNGTTLGRVLFYDTLLSANNTISCASCHQQEHAFADPAQFSRGFAGGLTGRNSPTLANGRYYARGHFFWDERANTLEDQVLMPIQDSVEMGLTLVELETRVAAQDYYPPLFAAAFGTPEVTSERISLALSQFVRSMVSYQSKYDIGLQQNFSNFTPEENLGRQVFFSPQLGNCAACHSTAAFVIDQPRNIGLDRQYADQGLGNTTGNMADNGKFKVASLRNIALTAPYMHDGRFDSLAEVINFYDRDIEPHTNLDPVLETDDGRPIRLRLPQREQQALIAFLNTLTDQSFITDPKFSDPFVIESGPRDQRVHLPYIRRH